MDFDFSAEQYAMRDEARRFLDEQCPASHVRAFVDDGWSRDLWKRMADLGWMALSFSEEDGGLGRSSLDLVLLLGELGRAVAPVPFLSSVAWAGQAIARHGSEQQRRRWLPAIASGDRVAALVVAVGEHSDGVGDVFAEHDDGGRWLLTGEQGHVLDAPAADLFVVAALGDDGPCWFVVEERVHVTRKRAFDPTRPIGTVVLDRSPAEALARPGLDPALGLAVAALCAEIVGASEKVLEMTVAYAQVREQFGRPIGSFQAIKHRCAEMATALEAARAAAYYACWACATDAEDAALAASVAKSYCSDVCADIGGEGVQVHGGIAFTWEHDMHLYLRRLKSAQVLLGDGAYHRERIARLVGL